MVSRVMQRRLNIGTVDSFLDGVLDQQDKLNPNRNELNSLRGVVRKGGSDTSSFMILAFLHVMIKYAEVQNRPQQQIDSGMADESSLV